MQTERSRRASDPCDGKDIMSEASNRTLLSSDDGTVSNILRFVTPKNRAAVLSTCKTLHNLDIKEHVLKEKEIKHSNRVTSLKAILLEKCRTIQKQKKYKNYCNNSGYRVGQQVEVIYDNDNSYWKGRYTASRLVGKHAYVVGVTPCFVRIVTGSLGRGISKFTARRTLPWPGPEHAGVFLATPGPGHAGVLVVASLLATSDVGLGGDVRGECTQPQ